MDKDKKIRDKKESGFGEFPDFETRRLINKDGSFNIIREGQGFFSSYQNSVEMGWGKFILLIVLVYILINAFFTILFLIAGYENLAGVPPYANFLEMFANTFFFSVQTFTTVGYGSMAPLGFWSNVIASFDALCGLLSLALATGLVFAKFSKPEAHIIFSQNAVIAPLQDDWSLQFRIVNQRDNRIIDLHATVVMSWLEKEGEEMRRHFSKLNLEIDNISLFPLNWTVVHRINEHSPLYNCDKNVLKNMHAEFMVMIDGHDETYAQKVHANTSYHFDEIKWFYRFTRMYRNNPDHGGTILDLKMIDDIEQV